MNRCIEGKVVFPRDMGAERYADAASVRVVWPIVARCLVSVREGTEARRAETAIHQWKCRCSPCANHLG